MEPDCELQDELELSTADSCELDPDWRWIERELLIEGLCLTSVEAYLTAQSLRGVKGR